MGKCSFLRANEVRALAQDNMLLWTEICGIQKAILEASSPCNIGGGALETIVNDGTPMTWVSGVIEVTVTDGGSDYEPVAAAAEIIHPLGSGANLTPIVNGGQITGFFINATGDDYQPVHTTLDVTSVAGNDAVLDPVVINGVIVAVNILAPGTDYDLGDVVVANGPDGNGSGFAATVTAVGLSGQIQGITITNNGTGYAPIFATIVIDHPVGVGFDGVVQVSNGGQVVGISIQNGGAGYNTLLPTAYVVDSTGTGAMLEIQESDIIGGVIQNIQIVSGGFGYSNPSVIITPAFSSNGDGAEATATIAPDPNNYGVTSPLYYAVLSGQSSDRMKTMQIEFVKDYFTSLGYNIRPQVNPQTGNTLQWWILW